MAAIIYIHGYGSSSNGTTSRKFKMKYPTAKIISYDTFEPRVALHNFVGMIDGCLKENKEVIVIASSLGGWMAEQLSKLRKINLYLYNPSLYPNVSLAKYGLDPMILEKYKSLGENIKDVGNSNPTKIWISEDDTVVDPKTARTYYANKSNVTINSTTGGHQMTDANFAKITADVDSLLGKLALLGK